MTVRGRYALMGLCWIGVALMVAWPSLNVPFFADDLHLIRTYSSAELQSVWTGPWDTDGIETAGYRPLTTVFNHLRATLFGENVTVHRLFLLGLFVLFLGLGLAVARMALSTSFGVGTLAGVLALTHLDSTYHYLWISDGVHLLGGVLIFAAIGLWLYALRTGQAWGLIGAAISGLLSLFVREDNLIVLPLLAWFTLMLRWNRSTPWRLAAKWWVLFTVTLVAGAGLFWWLRTRWVPAAMGLSLQASDYAWLIGQVVQNFGDRTSLIVWWPAYDAFIVAWWVCLGSLALIGLFGLSPLARRAAAGWLGAMLIAALPGLIFPRTNLILLAVTFWCLGMATVLWDFARRSRLAAVFATAVAVFAIVGGAWGSTSMQAESQPANLDWICDQPNWVYGDYAAATIPAERRAAVQSRLAPYGIYSAADANTRYPELLTEAIAAKRFGPNDQAAPFLPRFSVIVYPGWEDWSCLVRSGWVPRTSP